MTNQQAGNELHRYHTRYQRYNRQLKIICCMITSKFYSKTWYIKQLIKNWVDFWLCHVKFNCNVMLRLILVTNQRKLLVILMKHFLWLVNRLFYEPTLFSADLTKINRFIILHCKSTFIFFLLISICPVVFVILPS